MWELSGFGPFWELGFLLFSALLGGKKGRKNGKIIYPEYTISDF
jgi:hypothetical protein